jgi:hypothetical protein
MGIFNLTESERNEILSLHNNAKVLKEQTTPAASTPQDRKSKIMKLQTILKTKYNADLGVTGPNKDGIDGDLGAKTLGALSTIMKSKGTAAPAAPAAPAATTSPAAPAAPAATTSPAATTGTEVPAATQSPDEIMGIESTPQSNRDQRRTRQDLRRGNRRGMQDLKGQQRAQ